MNRRSFGVLGAGAALAACTRRTHDAHGRLRLRLWHSLGGRNREVLLAITKRFEAAHPDVVVEPVYQGDYFESLAKLRTAIASGSAPALTNVVAEVVPYLVRAGTLASLDAELGELPLVEALAQKGAFRGGGGEALVAIPLNRSTPLMYCNGDLFARAGLEPPKTWAELTAHARALTVPGKRFGFEVPIAWWFWVALVGQAGGTVFDDRGTPTLGGDAGVRAVRWWQDLVHREHVMRPPPGRDYDAWNMTNEDFLGGRAAFIWTSTAYIRYLEDRAKDRFPVVAAPLPSDARASVPTGGTFFVVPKRAPDAEKHAAVRFLKFFCDVEQATLLATRTGYLPITTPSVARMREDGFFAKHPNDDVAQRQLANVDPWPWEANLFRIERDIVDPRLEEAVLLDRDAGAVLAEARAAAVRPT